MLLDKYAFRPDELFAFDRFFKENEYITNKYYEYQNKYTTIIQQGRLGKILIESGFAYLRNSMDFQTIKFLSAIAEKSLVHSMNYSYMEGKSYFQKNLSWPPHPAAYNLIQKLLLPYLNELEVSYLFNNGYRLDEISFTVTNNIISQDSTQWHRDSVGNRIKIFFILDCTGNAPYTSIIANTARVNPVPANIDMIRLSPSGCSKDIQEQIENILCHRFSSQRVDIVQNAGDIFMFDTNSFHRSTIPAMISGEKEYKYGRRLMMQIEMMDIEASNFMNKFRLGPTAPGQVSPLLIELKDVDKLVAEFGVDRNCLHCPQNIPVISKIPTEYALYSMNPAQSESMI
jgi:hypothetical protein